MTDVSLDERGNADECGCRLSMAFLSVALAWVVGRRMAGDADLWTLANLWLLLGAATVGKVIGILSSRARYRSGVRTAVHDRS